MENPNWDITIYSSPGCFYCEQAKELCDRVAQKPKILTVGQDISAKDFSIKFPNVNAYPHIIVEGKVIGGLVEFAKFVIKEGLMTVKINGKQTG